jgi:N-acetylmuramoyl-L-alanine amidase
MSSFVTREFPDDPARRYPNNDFDPQNIQLAARVHQRLVQITGAPDRGIRRARFMEVLRWQRRPAVLIEGGYLSNPVEAGRIRRADYRQRLAEGVAAALVP